MRPHQRPGGDPMLWRQRRGAARGKQLGLNALRNKRRRHEMRAEAVLRSSPAGLVESGSNLFATRNDRSSTRAEDWCYWLLLKAGVPRVKLKQAGSLPTRRRERVLMSRGADPLSSSVIAPLS